MKGKDMSKDIQSLGAFTGIVVGLALVIVVVFGSDIALAIDGIANSATKLAHIGK